MSEETQVGSEASTSEVQGTTQEGQSNQSSEVSNQPNDQTSFQADYTRKYQALADERKALEAEREAFRQQQSQYQQQPQQNYNQNAYQQVPQNTANMTQQQLIDNFGFEGAQAILQMQQGTQQQIQQAQVSLLQMQLDSQGRAKYGAEWDQFSYTDPVTGQVKNKVVDFQCSINPLTGQKLTLEQAFAAAKFSDPQALDKIKQEQTDKTYQEMQRKEVSQPVVPSNAQPGSIGSNKPLSLDESLAMARGGKGI